MAIDIIGDLFEPVEFPEGFVPGDPEPAPVQIPGWHVNITPDVLADRPELEPFMVAPSPFHRLFAGDTQDDVILTVALRFADETEGRTYFPEDDHDGL